MLGAPSKEALDREAYELEQAELNQEDETICPLCGGPIKDEPHHWDEKNQCEVHDECYENCKPYMTVN